MYSWEIDNLLKSKNYTISAFEYLDICQGSVQITEIKYNGFDESYEIKTTDNYYWKFKLTRKGENL